MKLSTTKLFLLLTMVPGPTAAQAGWAHVQSIEGPYTVSGTVAYSWGDSLAIACGYTMDPDSVSGCPLLVSGMGPAGWWSVNEVTFPTTGQEVVIGVYRVTSSVGDIKYVAADVIDNGDGQSLVLRIPIYDGDAIHVLDPAWSMMEPLAAATALSSASAEDAECTCKCACKGDACDCDCLCDSADCNDCAPVGDEHQWRGERRDAVAPGKN